MAEQQVVIPKIDPKVFRIPRVNRAVQDKVYETLKETPVMPIITEAKGWPDIPQGIELYYQNIPYPRKGFPDAEIINALHHIKKDTALLMGLFANKELIPSFIVFNLLPYKWKIKVLNSFLYGFLRKANSNLTFWYYLPQYYCVFAKELQNLIRFFLLDLKLNWDYSDNVALIFCMFMEHDDAFRIRVQDLFNSVTQEELLKAPIRTLRKIARLIKEREKQWPSLVNRITAPINILCVLLLIPRYRRAFKKAVRLADWKKLQFDEGDKYWAKTWQFYDAEGKDFETRNAELNAIHKNMPIPMAKINYN